MTHFLIGFAIAVAVGLTGIGGGSFTVPALVLIAGLPASEAVVTAFVSAGVIRLVAAPFYMLKASPWIRPRERAAGRSESVWVLSFCVSRPQHVARR